MRRRRLALAVGVAALGAALAAAWFARERAGRFDMSAELAQLAAAQQLWDNPWERGVEKAADLRRQLAAERHPGRRFQLHLEIARHYVYDGKPEIAVGLLEDGLRQAGERLPPAALAALKTDLALAYLRLGEQQNCAWNHAAESCIFPVQGGGVHRGRLGSEQALAILADLLAMPTASPDQRLAWRWLHSIAAMTLGQYPDGVDPALRIPPEALASQGPMPRFTDRAASRGLTHFGTAGGAILDDFTNDGHLDLLLGSWGTRDPIEFFVNDGRGHFARATAGAGLAGITGGLHLVQADYDNDGWLDALVLRGAWLHERGRIPNSLLRNNGDGSFTDVTAQAGVLSHYPAQSAAWSDLDLDGDLDLVIGNELRHGDVEWPADARNVELYLNDGEGRFREVAAAAGIAVRGMIKGLTAGDVDDDGRPDLYFSLMGAPNHLLRNLGPGADGVPRFADVTAAAGVGEPAMSFACWFWDYDQDGREDLLVFGYQAELSQIVADVLGDPAARGERPRLYRNLGPGPDGAPRFEDVTRAAGLHRLILAMGSNFGDLDHDGWPDFYAGTGSPAFDMLIPNRMFRGDGRGGFQDVTTAGGFGHLQKGHAVSFGDVDGDGDQDVFELVGGAYTGDAFHSVLFENPGTPGARGITLRLEGVRANRSAIGARLRVDVRTASGARRSVHHTVGSGGSFGANSLQAEIGLGDAQAIERIEVRWPGGATQVIDGPLALDRAWRLREGEAPVAVPAGAP